MSISELTRNSFQSGLSAATWAGLCKLFNSKDVSLRDQETTETEISNSVLLLFRSYLGDPDLHSYLKYAVRNGLVSVPVFVATLLQAARSPELHHGATLDMFCRIALGAHYSSGLPSIGSLVAYGEPPSAILGIIQDAFALLRTAYTLPMSHFHQLTTSSSELVVALLSCITDISQLPTGQAMALFADVNDLLQNFRVGQEVRHVLESFALSLSLAIGDDAKVARGSQMIHTEPSIREKGDMVGHGSNIDIAALSFVFRHLVTFRGTDHGAGGGDYPAALLVGVFRWTSWTPVVFYTQLYLSVFTCLMQCAANPGALVWRAFIIGRLPSILLSFQKYVNAENTNTVETDWKIAHQAAFTALLRRNDLLMIVNTLFSKIDKLEEQRQLPRSFMQQQLALGLIDQRIAVSLDSRISNFHVSTLQSEAEEAGYTLSSYLEWKLSRDSHDDTALWMDKIWSNCGSHATFADFVCKRLTACAGHFDIEGLSQLCKNLHSRHYAVDILALHSRLSDPIAHILLFLEGYNCETVGDPQGAMNLLGVVVLFVQSILIRFKLHGKLFVVKDRKLNCEYLIQPPKVLTQEMIPPEDLGTFKAWLKTLFDSSSEGIEDTILRSTHPKVLLRLSPNLLLHAITMNLEGRIDNDLLNNGVMYFIDPVLNWTLVSIVKALLEEIQRRKFDARVHFEVLQTIVTSQSCPKPVIVLCGPLVLALLNKIKQGASHYMGSFNAEIVHNAVSELLGIKQASLIQNLLTTNRHVGWRNQPKLAIQDALATARAGKGPFIDVARCLRIVAPTRFLELLWSQLMNGAGVGGSMEGGKRLVVLILTLPLPGSPPLFPLFINTVLPSLISHIDQLPVSEQAAQTEMLQSIITSLFTAAISTEVAMRTVLGQHGPVLGQHSSVMARRLVAELRTRKLSYTSSSLSQRLSTSTPCVANFPIFMDLESLK
ncbi:hypothetical protein E1B28_001148 [Marasmius oreades]|uniref:Mediator of RNA polymerase II transcription subunit 5 n=1 Tax=Marasmius oreades TaxID=181124 RepID=A0A9P7V2X6_9AGAR|nr:uncharacterized protein E1B28_001148 [Marasmius oreades]KAG7099289.1 hypothetical protein E1B28_001148 [Marasmius oreades]